MWIVIVVAPIRSAMEGEGEGRERGEGNDDHFDARQVISSILYVYLILLGVVDYHNLARYE